MMRTMDLFVSTGLRDAGFDTVSVDDCWVASRDATGVPVADPTSFPSGMKALADYAHARGLKFGLYSSNSPTTCSRRPGSFGFEAIDAAAYASWGVDLLKYDNCGNQAVIGPPERGYAVMRDALNATGRPIFFAACEWAVDFPSTWMAPVANTWRTTYDIQNNGECWQRHVDWQNVFADQVGPGGFGDMDILEVGNGVLTPEEGKAHLSLWVAMKSPVLIGCDLAQPDCASNVTLFTNPEVIAISQDALGAPARRVAAAGDTGMPVGKSGTCGTEELPQNTVLRACDATDALQQWAFLPNGSITLPATGECLQLDSGQGGHCAQNWAVWTNNVASALCGDPSSTCESKQELWAFDESNYTLTNNASGQCLTVHSALVNVGALPCAIERAAFQTWTRGAAGTLVSAVAAPGGRKACLARTRDVAGGATEAWAGPLANGDAVVLLWNRNAPAAANVSVDLARVPGFGAPGARAAVRDVWARADVGVVTGRVSALVPLHGVAMLRLRAA